MERQPGSKTLGADVWDIVLEDLEAQHYRERARVVHLRLVGA